MSKATESGIVPIPLELLAVPARRALAGAGITMLKQIPELKDFRNGVVLLTYAK
jgi:hypothetical protein